MNGVELLSRVIRVCFFCFELNLLFSLYLWVRGSMFWGLLNPWLGMNNLISSGLGWRLSPPFG